LKKFNFYKDDENKQREIKLDYFHEVFNKMLEKGDVEVILNNKRTLLQNNALHKYFQLLSEELNNQGLDFTKIFKNPVAIMITPEIVKECIWKPIQKAMFKTKSTTKLSKQDQIDKIYDVINKKFSEDFEIFVEFPRKED
jgi:hypothetical protein